MAQRDDVADPPLTEPDPGALELLQLVGKTVAGKYRVLRLIGQGGMGAVFEAEHLGLGKRVAMKFVRRELATDDTLSARFAREARAASSIESAHIVTCFDTGSEDGLPYLVMEILRGEDLGQRLRRTRTIPVAEALHVTAQILRGLMRAHEAGIVHRDLKPDNVFLSEVEGDPLHVKIVDFGISKIQKGDNKTLPLALTGRGIVLGTPFYMSPEQAQALDDVDARTDLWAVGAILFESLTGRPPHVGEHYEQVILSICMKDAPDVRAIEPAVPEPVSRFVARSLERDRAQRFASARMMLAALHEIAPEERTRAPLDPPALQTERSPGLHESAPPDTPRPSASVRASPAPAKAPAPIDDGEDDVPRGVPKSRRHVVAPLLSFLAVVAGGAVTWLLIQHFAAAPPIVVVAPDAEPPTSARPPADAGSARPAPSASASASARPPVRLPTVKSQKPSSSAGSASAPQGLGSGLPLVREPP